MGSDALLAKVRQSLVCDQGRSLCLCEQDYKSLCFLTPWLTDRQTWFEVSMLYSAVLRFSDSPYNDDDVT